ncbi:MAG: hypothetical protein LBD10_07440 [Desulfobulbus sp.]|jgi:hypothetical protein|uniref:hypothetical protein n=1 Tax=Desulfobulbus sp. TaxID=895 RepID=UPI00284AE4E4|nr:hypothetical protein [Desulfobulbus sp.]MDR2550011.1 hypothetical protein [Desulfobulbus sp.]
MAGITLEMAEARLRQYLDAEQKILLGQETAIDGDRLTLADLAAVQAGVALWNGRVKELTPAAAGGGIRTVEIIPR